MSTPRRASLAVLAGLAVTGIVGAAAASFGGLDAESLGSESTVVAACDTEGGIDVGFTTSFADGDYVVDSVDFSEVDDECAGLDFDVTLTDGDGDAIGSADGTVALDSNRFSVSFSGVTAESVEGVALVISG